MLLYVGPNVREWGQTSHGGLRSRHLFIANLAELSQSSNAEKLTAVPYTERCIHMYSRLAGALFHRLSDSVRSTGNYIFNYAYIATSCACISLRRYYKCLSMTIQEYRIKLEHMYALVQKLEKITGEPWESCALSEQVACGLIRVHRCCRCRVGIHGECTRNEPSALENTSINLWFSLRAFERVGKIARVSRIVGARSEGMILVNCWSLDDLYSGINTRGTQTIRLATANMLELDFSCHTHCEF